MPSSYIELGGNPTPATKKLYLRGPIQTEQAEVFVPRIADVSPEEDRRTGPSQRSLNDFSDGVGVLFGDLGSGLWESAGVWSMEGGQLLPPPSIIASNNVSGAGISFDIRDFPVCRPVISDRDPAGTGEYVYVIVGNSVQAIHSSGTITKLDASLSKIGRTLLIYGGPTLATPQMYAFYRNTFGGAQPVFRVSGVNNWHNVGAWAAGDRHISDAIVFDGKLVGEGGDGKMYFTVDGGANPTWNDEVAADGKPLLDLGYYPMTMFVGVASAPWGNPEIYFLHRGQLRVLNFNARQSFEIPIQAAMPLMVGCIWQGQVVVSDYYSVYAYDPSSQTSKRIGLPKRAGGRPPSMSGMIRHLFPAGEHLGAILTSDPFLGGSPSTKGKVSFYNERGWHIPYADLRPSGAQSHGIAGGVAQTPSPISFNDMKPQVVVLSSGTVDDATQTVGVDIVRYALPKSGSPFNGRDTCKLGIKNGDQGCYADLPWIRVHPDLDGALIGVMVNSTMAGSGVGTDPVIYIDYRVDVNTAMKTQTGFTNLGMVDYLGAPFKFLPFGTADANNLRPGKKFRSVQFRVLFGSRNDAAPLNVTSWPEFYGITLVFSKYSLRKVTRMLIDVVQTIAEDATLRNASEVWEHIQNCINNPLVFLHVPNFYKARGLITNAAVVQDELLRQNEDSEPGSARPAPATIQLVFEDVAPYDADGFAAQQTPT
jgi:hypothetical protein